MKKDDSQLTIESIRMEYILEPLLHQIYLNNNILTCEITINNVLKLIEIKNINNCSLNINNFPFLNILQDSDTNNSALIEANLKISDLSQLSDFLATINNDIFSNNHLFITNKQSYTYNRFSYEQEKLKAI